MDNENGHTQSYVVPRDFDIAALVSLVATIAVIGLWRLVG
jgi:hypothetical protein